MRFFTFEHSGGTIKMQSVVMIITGGTIHVDLYCKNYQNLARS